MMDENKPMPDTASTGHSCCRMGGPSHKIWWIVLKIVVAIIIFHAGMELGEMKSAWHGGRSDGYDGFCGGPRGGMMQGWNEKATDGSRGMMKWFNGDEKTETQTPAETNTTTTK